MPGIFWLEKLVKNTDGSSDWTYVFSAASIKECDEYILNEANYPEIVKEY